MTEPPIVAVGLALMLGSVLVSLLLGLLAVLAVWVRRRDTTEDVLQ